MKRGLAFAFPIAVTLSVFALASGSIGGGSVNTNSGAGSVAITCPGGQAVSSIQPGNSQCAAFATSAGLSTDGGLVQGFVKVTQSVCLDSNCDSYVTEDAFNDILVCANGDAGFCTTYNASTGEVDLPTTLKLASGGNYQQSNGTQICGTQSNGCFQQIDGGEQGNEFFIPSNLSSGGNPIAYTSPRLFLWCPGGNTCASPYFGGSGPDPAIFSTDAGELNLLTGNFGTIQFGNSATMNSANSSDSVQMTFSGNADTLAITPNGQAIDKLIIGASDAGGAFIAGSGGTGTLTLQGNTAGTGTGPVVQNAGTDNFGTAGNGVVINLDGGFVCTNGGLTCLPKSDHFLSITDTVTAVGTTGDIWVAPAATQNAMTLQGANTTVQIAGGGTGTLTAKLSSAASGGGTVFATCTTACNGAVNLVTACTVNTSAVPASTTFHYAITTACTTADVQNVVGILFSQP